MTVATNDLRQLRRDIRARRAALSPAHRIAAAQQVAARLQALSAIPKAGYVAGYWAVDGEMPLHVWQLSLPADCIYCLPVLGDDALLRFAPWRSGDALVANRFGIPEPDVATSSLLEPADLAAIVMPLVAFDAACNRVGMGGGWYDRSLAGLSDRTPRPLLVGAAYELQRVDALTPAEWDIPLDAVCTESDTYLATA
ncbi:5-formyltetrahydrofolate cyclo-ligase [Lysobacter sp. TY2-98]|uniref:5-formyltetrahydrofolate cyclo-ligase n=1 Tax=Lysobacter sp. TY2-98 TaxID=2290922 RepID=UPI000E20637F|nr:5-formyltetrahydrofolate cyclo-ligase [Lysobacter sp. TY2-98]AXK72615.1 5-formyltetrahydrofolate cyclo-ligase [Lysobacter sp. TY2-98]